MPSKRYKFLLSNIPPKEKESLTAMITELQGSVSTATTEYDPEATHVVVPRFAINEQTLGAMAAGKWIVYKKFIEDSYLHNKWKQESRYEMGRLKDSSAKYYVRLIAAKRCREMVLVKAKPYFSGWKVGILITNERRRRRNERILLAGGASIVELTWPLAEAWEISRKQLNFVLTDMKYEQCWPLVDAGISCILPAYINGYLLQDPVPLMKKYMIKKTGLALSTRCHTIIQERSDKQELPETSASNIPEAGTNDAASKEKSSGIQVADKEIERNLTSLLVQRNEKEINLHDTILQVTEDVANVHDESIVLIFERESTITSKENNNKDCSSNRNEAGYADEGKFSTVKKEDNVNINITSKENNYKDCSSNRNEADYADDEGKLGTVKKEDNYNINIRPEIKVINEDVCHLSDGDSSIYLSDDSDVVCEQDATDTKKVKEEANYDIKWPTINIEDDSSDSDISIVHCVRQSKINLRNNDEPFSTVKNEAIDDIAELQWYTDDEEYDDVILLKDANIDNPVESKFITVKKEEAKNNIMKCECLTVDDDSDEEDEGDVTLIDNSSVSFKQNFVDSKNIKVNLDDFSTDRKREANYNIMDCDCFIIDDDHGEVTMIPNSYVSLKQNFVYSKNEKPNNIPKCDSSIIDDDVIMDDLYIKQKQSEEVDPRNHNKPNFSKVAKKANDNICKYFAIDDDNLALVDEHKQKVKQNEEVNLYVNDESNFSTIRMEEVNDKVTKHNCSVDDSSVKEVSLLRDDSDITCKQKITDHKNEIKLNDDGKSTFSTFRKRNNNNSTKQYIITVDEDNHRHYHCNNPNVWAQQDTTDFKMIRAEQNYCELKAQNDTNIAADSGKDFISDERTPYSSKDNNIPSISVSLSMHTTSNVGIKQSFNDKDITLESDDLTEIEQTSTNKSFINNKCSRRKRRKGNMALKQSNLTSKSRVTRLNAVAQQCQVEAENTESKGRFCELLSMHTTSNVGIKQSFNHKDITSESADLTEIEQTSTNKSFINNKCNRRKRRKGNMVLKQNNLTSKSRITRLNAVAQQSQVEVENVESKGCFCELKVQTDTNVTENSAILTTSESTPYSSKDDNFSSSTSLSVSAHIDMGIKQCINNKDANSENADLTETQHTTSTERKVTNHVCSRRKRSKGNTVIEQIISSGENRITRTSKVVQQDQAEHSQSDADPLEMAIKIAFYTYFDNPSERLSLEWASSCTKNPFSCPNNHEIIGKELCDAHSKMLKSLIKMNHFNAALWYCNELLTQHHYPVAYIFFGFLSLILNTHEEKYLGSASAIFRRMISTHPPCAPQMRCYYKTILMDPMEDFIGETKNGFMLEIISRLSELINEENEVPAEGGKENMPHSSSTRARAETSEECESKDNSALSTQEETQRFIAQIDGSSSSSKSRHVFNITELQQKTLCDHRDEAFQATEVCLDYTSLSREDKLQRILRVGDLLVDLMERDLTVLLVKDMDELKKALRTKAYQPLIVTVLWRSETSTQIGRLNTVCRSLIDLYVQGIRLKLPRNILLLIMRILALVAEVSFIVDFKKEYPYPYFGTYCQNLAQEIGIRVLQLNPDGVSTAVSMINLAWLKLLVTHFLTAQIMHEEPFKRIKLEAVISWLQTQRPPVIDIEPMETDESEAEEPQTVQSRMQAAKINKRDAKGETRLHRLCRGGKVNELKKILQHPDINVNPTDNCGWTPLHEAVWHNRLECVQLLLDYTPPSGGNLVDINPVSDTGFTPFMDAVSRNHLEVAKLLLKYGGSILLDVKSSEDELIIFHMAGTFEMRELLRKVASERPTGIRSTEAYKKPLPDVVIKLIPHLIDSYIATYRIVNIMTQLSHGALQDRHCYRENKVKLQFDLTAYNKDIEHLLEIHTLLKKLKGAVREYYHTYKFMDFVFAPYRGTTHGNFE